MKGFTLIELLVVVLIIGILVAIALPQYWKAVDKARYMQMVVTLDAMKTGEEAYYLANGVYTTQFRDLDVTPDPHLINCSGDNSSCLTDQKNYHYYATSATHTEEGENTGLYLWAEYLGSGYTVRYLVYLDHGGHSWAGKKQCRTYGSEASQAKGRALCLALGGKLATLGDSLSAYNLN